MSKNTAVEWLVTELRNQIAEGTLDAIAISKLKMQAKAMEREQIKESYKAGFNYRDTFNWECDAPWEAEEDFKHNEQEFDKYYIETYKGGEQ
jgi:hypothetical protein